MNNKLMIGIMLVIALLFGAIIGSRFSRKIEQRNKTLAIQPIRPSPKLPAQKQPGQKGPRTYYFVIPEIKDRTHLTEDKVAELEKMMSTPQYKISIVIKNNKAVVPTLKPDSGIMDATKLSDINRLAENLTPLFTASPIEQTECYSEIQFVTLKKNAIHSMDDFKGKNVATSPRAIPLLNLPLTEMLHKDIRFGTIYIQDTPSTLLNSLYTGKADLLALRVMSLSNNEVISILGNMASHGYPNFGDIKVISTTNNRIPCNYIFVRARLPAEAKELMTSKLTYLFYNPQTKPFMIENLELASIKPVNPEEWKAVKEKTKNIFKFELESSAAKIVNEVND